MANVRIKDLTTTAATTASDDFFGVDGATNGTRKLNAYSPTFGGNLTVSGTGTNSITATKATGGQLPLIYTGDGSYSAWQIQNSNGFVLFGKESTSGGQLFSTATANAGVIAVSGANNFELSTNNTKRLTIDGSTGAATLSGNLTVSGTGTSSFGGAISANGPLTLTIAARSVAMSAPASGGVPAIIGTTTNHSVKINAGLNSAEGEILFSTDGTERARLFANGNLFIGASPVDSANGKLQLATHTTSAGGIGFGAEFSLFRKSSDTVVLNNTGTVNVFKLAEAGTDTVYLNSVSGVGTLGTATAKSLVLATNGTTALTLDSSQNATFAGSIAIGNTVQTAASVASTHKVTISIGGSTYYLLATNV